MTGEYPSGRYFHTTCMIGDLMVRGPAIHAHPLGTPQLPVPIHDMLQVLFGGYGGDNRAARKAMEKEASARKLGTKGFKSSDIPPAKHPDLFILDTVSMEWVQPEAGGPQPTPRCVPPPVGRCVRH